MLTCVGTLGQTVTVEEGAEAAAVCALNALAVLESGARLARPGGSVLSVTGYVASAPDFHRQPDVVDGASAVLFDIFGAGRTPHPVGHRSRRAAPGGAVEIELTASLRD